jgi:hypothetical protein
MQELEPKFHKTGFSFGPNPNEEVKCRNKHRIGVDSKNPHTKITFELIWQV